jgi:hypothetical protein
MSLMIVVVLFQEVLLHEIVFRVQAGGLHNYIGNKVIAIESACYYNRECVKMFPY